MSIGTQVVAFFVEPPTCTFGNFIQEVACDRYPMFTTLVAAVNYAREAEGESIIETLQNMTGTVLCPTNMAFKRAKITTQDGKIFKKGQQLDPKDVKNVLLGHVILASEGFPFKEDEADEEEEEEDKEEKEDEEEDEEATINQFTKYKNYKNEILTFTTTKKNMRTTVALGKRNACILLQGFKSRNVQFAAIGRVLL